MWIREKKKKALIHTTYPSPVYNTWDQGAAHSMVFGLGFCLLPFDRRLGILFGPLGIKK